MKKIIIIVLIFFILLLILIAKIHFFSKKNENIYNSTVLENYISNNLGTSKKVVIINGEKYNENDIRLKQYFFGEDSELSYNEVINTIILSKEAENRNIKLDEDVKNEIIDRINNYNFSNDLLKKIDYEEEILKEIMIETLIEIELKRCLIDEVNKEIINNNITIENKELKEETQDLYDFYLSIKNTSVNEFSENEINNIIEEYMKKVDLIKDKYLEKIKEDIEIEYLIQ